MQEHNHESKGELQVNLTTLSLTNTVVLVRHANLICVDNYEPTVTDSK